MKKFGLFTNALIIVVLSFSLNFSVFAQKTTLPADLTEKSSLEEILNRLDQTSLPEARIGLEANVKEPETGELITSVTRYYEWAFFSKGFRVAKIDGCKLTLRNDDIKLIHFETKYPDPTDGSLDEFRKNQDNKSEFTGEFSIPLQILKANKPPYRHTKKAEKAALLGVWRTEFTAKFKFFLFPTKEKIKSLLENQLKIEIVGIRQDGRNDSMKGDEITFTFDDKRTSENFYTAFSRAITLCKDE